MHVIHLYDGHEKVHGGRGSVPSVVWNVARETAAAGHDVTVMERQWAGLPASATHDGVRFERLSLRTGPDEPWTRVPYDVVESPRGLAGLVLDRANFARAALARLWRHEYDVLHVHLPFAANVVLTLAPWLRSKTVYTAHLGELRLNLLTDEEEGSDQPTAVESRDDEPTDAAEQVAGGPTPPTTGEGGGRTPAVERSGGGRTSPLEQSDDDPVEAARRVDGGTPVIPADQDDSTPRVPRILSRFSPDDYLARRAAATTVLNPSIEAAFVERGVPADRLTVVPNGVDVERFGTVSEAERERVREAYDLDEGPFVFFVGTIMPRKGVVELVRAVAQVRSSTGVAPTVILAGDRDLDEEYTERVERLIDDAGLGSAVQLPGFVPAEDLPALYALADVFAVPSLEEGFGMTAVEALAAGTPVVGTRVGGLPHVLEEGAHGELVPPGDVDALADALGSLLTDPERLAAVGGRARERAADFAWPAVADQFEQVYAEVGR